MDAFEGTRGAFDSAFGFFFFEGFPHFPWDDISSRTIFLRASFHWRLSKATSAKVHTDWFLFPFPILRAHRTHVRDAQRIAYLLASTCEHHGYRVRRRVISDGRSSDPRTPRASTERLARGCGGAETFSSSAKRVVIEASLTRGGAHEGGDQGAPPLLYLLTHTHVLAYVSLYA